MPTPEEPGDRKAENSQDRDSGEAMSLVDYFDKIDRDAFRRALEHRDSYFRAGSRT